MANYDSYDLSFTWDGDYSVAENGDFSDNESDAIVSLETEIRTVVKSEIKDWEKHPFIGANLSDFLGEPNTRETGKEIEDRITSALITSTILRGGDFSVRVIPTSAHQVLVIITVSVDATPRNRLAVGEPIVVALSYDTIEDSVFFLQTDNIESAYRG